MRDTGASAYPPEPTQHAHELHESSGLLFKTSSLNASELLMLGVSFEDHIKLYPDYQAGIGNIRWPLDRPSEFDRSAERLLTDVEYSADLRTQRNRAGTTIAPIEGNVEVAEAYKPATLPMPGYQISRNVISKRWGDDQVVHGRPARVSGK